MLGQRAIRRSDPEPDRLPDRQPPAFVLVDAAIVGGDLAKALRWYRPAQMVPATMGQPNSEFAMIAGGSIPLVSAAALAAASREHERAARLFGAAQRLREELGAPATSAHTRLHEGAHTSVQAALGGERFSREWTLGYAMGPEAVRDEIEATLDVVASM